MTGLKLARLEDRTPVKLAIAIAPQLRRQRCNDAPGRNRPQGFDCPGCAWADPKHTSSFEFCENGGKTIAWEVTAK